MTEVIVPTRRGGTVMGRERVGGAVPGEHRRRRGVSGTPLELLLFHTDPRVVAEATEAGIDGFIVDWERRGKVRRQGGEGTEIKKEQLPGLGHGRAATPGPGVVPAQRFRSVDGPRGRAGGAGGGRRAAAADGSRPP